MGGVGGELVVPGLVLTFGHFSLRKLPSSLRKVVVRSLQFLVVGKVVVPFNLSPRAPAHEAAGGSMSTNQA